MQPLFSIIVPIYKVEKYLPACVESLMAQKLEELEIILVNDGSPDGCLELCEKYAEMDGRIKVVDKPNGGLISARKVGLAVATGTYIGFVDGDDCVELDLYCRLAILAKEDNPDIIAMGFSFLDDASGRLTKRPETLPTGMYDRANIESKIHPVMMCNYQSFERKLAPAIWAKLIKKSLIEQVLPELDEKIRDGEDAAVTYPCMLLANSVYMDSGECGYRYRVLKNSMSHGYDENWADSASRYCKWMDCQFTKYLGDDYGNVLRYNLDVEKFNMFYRYIGREMMYCKNLRVFNSRVKTILYGTEIGKVARDFDVMRLPLGLIRRIILRIMQVVYAR